MRRAEDLLDKLHEERVWRIKEISTLTALSTRPNITPVERDIFCRAGVTLTYSHWEGFVKRAAVHYLKFVSFQRLRLDEMSDPILSLYVAQCVNENSDRTKSADFAGRLLRNSDFRPKLAWKKVVNTESNLSSTVLRSICNTLGFDISHFQPRFVFLDEVVIKQRNSIVHGDKGEVDVERLQEIATGITALITTFRDVTDNAAATKAFKRP